MKGILCYWLKRPYVRMTQELLTKPNYNHDLMERRVKKKILVVEDHPDCREILALLLTQIGYHVIKAQNSKDAIVCAEAEEPALIFMDMELPDVDGIRTSALLKQNPKTSHIPIVALTAWMSELWREKASKVGIKTYLLKPVSSRMLKEAIEEFTDESRIRTNAVTPSNVIF
jgi:two-component system, cell cycle response regulator DivK